MLALGILSVIAGLVLIAKSVPYAAMVLRPRHPEDGCVGVFILPFTIAGIAVGGGLVYIGARVALGLPAQIGAYARGVGLVLAILLLIVIELDRTYRRRVGRREASGSRRVHRPGGADEAPHEPGT